MFEGVRSNAENAVARVIGAGRSAINGLESAGVARKAMEKLRLEVETDSPAEFTPAERRYLESIGMIEISNDTSVGGASLIES
jgi:hypothetical protein